MNMRTALAVNQLASNQPIDLRNPAPPALSDSVEALLEVVALAPTNAPTYLPDDFLTRLLA